MLASACALATIAACARGGAGGSTTIAAALPLSAFGLAAAQTLLSMQTARVVRARCASHRALAYSVVNLAPMVCKGLAFASVVGLGRATGVAQNDFARLGDVVDAALAVVVAAFPLVCL